MGLVSVRGEKSQITWVLKFGDLIHSHSTCSFLESCGFISVGCVEFNVLRVVCCKKLKSIGEITDPCGTPARTASEVDMASL